MNLQNQSTKLLMNEVKELNNPYQYTFVFILINLEMNKPGILDPSRRKAKQEKGHMPLDSQVFISSDIAALQNINNAITAITVEVLVSFRFYTRY